MFCKYCGAEIKSHAKFCRKCGADLGEKTEESVRETLPASVQRPKYKYGRAIFVIALVLIIASIFAVKRGYDKRQEERYTQILSQTDNYIKDKKYEKALAACTEAMKIKSTDAGLYIRLGDAYNGMQDTENALKNYQKALKLGTTSKEIYDGLLRIYYKSDMWDELLDTCDNAIKNLHEGKEYYQEIKNTYENYQRAQALQETFNNYERASGSQNDSKRIRTFGFSFAGLIDFEGDGKEKVVVVYTAETYDIDYLPESIDDYILEIWDYSEGKSQKVFQGKPYYGASGEREVILSNVDNQWYLKTGDMNADGKATYCGFKDGEFIQNIEPDMTTGTDKTYVLQGYLSDETKIAYNTVANTEQKLNYEIESLRYGLKNTILNEKDETVPITNGSYIYESNNLNMYVCTYLSWDGNAEMSLKYNYADETTYSNWNNLIFQYNKDKGIYEEKDAPDGKETIISVSQHDEKINIAVLDPFNKKNVQAQVVRETKYDN